VDAVLARAVSVPAAKQAGVTTTLPMAGGGATLHFNIHGRPPKGPDDYTLAGYRAVTPGYLPAVGVPLLRGRMFTDRDRRGSVPVALVNETLARRFFAGQDPIGQRLQIGATPDAAIPWMEVVGVVGDVRQSFDADAQAEMFVPYLQGAPDPILGGLFRNVSVVVRTTGDPAQAAGALRDALRDVDRDQPIVKMRTMEEAIGTSVAAPRFRTMLVGLFALAALVLAVVGVYGVTAYGVSQRRQEIGLRMALGARGADVLRLVMGQGVRLVALGTVVGLAGGFGLARLLGALLFETHPADPATFAVVAVVLVVASLAASYLPARRATSATLKAGMWSLIFAEPESAGCS